MKQQFNRYTLYALLPLLSLGLGSCSDDELPASGLSVISSKVNMSAAAATGYIVVSQTGGFTAESTESWCTTECRADSVLVTVTDNTALEGRTAMVKLTAVDGSSTSVAVTQSGGYFRIEGEPSEFRLDDSACSFDYALSSSFDFTATSNASWLTAEPKDGKVKLNVAENTTGEPRYACVSFFSAKMDRTIEAGIYQYNVSDLTGNWTALWTDKNGSAKQGLVEVVMGSDGKLSLTGLYEGISVPLEAYESSFAVVTNSYAGVYGGRFEVYVSGATSNHIVRTKENESVARRYYCLPTYNENSFSYPFVADSTFVDGEALGGFALTAYSDGKNQGSISEFYGLSLTR